MSDYMDQVKSLVKPELAKYGLKILPRGKNSFSIMKGSEIFMTIRDTGDNVELSFKGKKYMYDKWYTKPEHLAQVVFNVLEAELAPKKEG